MKSTFSIIFYLKRQVVKKDGTVPVMKNVTLLFKALNSENDQRNERITVNVPVILL